MTHGKIRRTLILAIVLAALWIPEAYSEQIPEGQRQEHPAQHNDYPADNNGDSFGFIIKGVQTFAPTKLPTNYLQYATHDQATQHDDDRSPSLTDWLLVFFTAVLGGVSIWQGIQLRNTVEEMGRGTAITKTLASAANKGANAIISSERAYLFLYEPNAKIFPVGSERMYQESIPLKTKPIMEWSVINMGRTPAVLMEIRIKLYMGKAIPPIRDFKDSFLWKGQFILKSEKTYTVAPVSYDRVLTVQEVKELQQENDLYFFFFGNISYQDVFGIIYERGFCLKYLPKINNFSIDGGDEYNYEINRSSKQQEADKPPRVLCPLAETAT